MKLSDLLEENKSKDKYKYKSKTKNIESIELWLDNPDKSRISYVVKINFKFPCKWTILSIEDLKNILRLWIKGEEKKYPPPKYKGRYLLLQEILKTFLEE